MSYTETVTRNVKAEAARRGFTNQDIAQVLAMSVTSVSKRMTGRIEFRPSELEKIADLMEVPISVLTEPPATQAGRP